MVTHLAAIDGDAMHSTIHSSRVRSSTLLAKLSASPRENGLALALRNIGRINRSIFVAQWSQTPEMRRNTAAGFNESTAQNSLARALFFNRLGELRDTFESQFYRASGLKLLINAIVCGNTLVSTTFAELTRDHQTHRARLDGSISARPLTISPCWPLDHMFANVGRIQNFRVVMPIVSREIVGRGPEA